MGIEEWWIVMDEIIFNGKGNLTDFGTFLIDFNPQPPAPKIIKADVPFMNGAYDFSTVATNGEMVFTEREILCSLDFPCDSKTAMLTKYSQLLEWLLSTKGELIYTAEPNMKYIARVEKVPSFSTFSSKDGTLTFSFIADPFKYGVDFEGNKPWDNFNFEADLIQDTEFDISGTQIIKIFNPGRAVIPLINCSSRNMTALLGTYTTNLTTGDNKDWRFRLNPGENQITVTGTGKIKFIFFCLD
jgi:predicted phage tail component-like protein